MARSLGRLGCLKNNWTYPPTGNDCSLRAMNGGSAVKTSLGTDFEFGVPLYSGDFNFDSNNPPPYTTDILWKGIGTYKNVYENVNSYEVSSDDINVIDNPTKYDSYIDWDTIKPGNTNINIYASTLAYNFHGDGTNNTAKVSVT